MSIGAHTVSVLPPAGGSPTDISCLVDSVSINHGRSDADSPPDAQSCTVEISLDTLTTALPPVIDIGAYLFVSTKVAGMTLARPPRIMRLFRWWPWAIWPCWGAGWWAMCHGPRN